MCFKPLPFSDLNNRLSDKLADVEDFQSILDAMTIYRPPEGVSDSGMFELLPEYLTEIDPYIAQYNRNQREESENIVRAYLKKSMGTAGDDIVIEPKLRPIRTGVFADLAVFTRTPLFVQVIYYSLGYPLAARSPNIPAPPAGLIKFEPLLGIDTFVFLTECAVYLVPAFHLDIPHILRLCYLAEIVKVVLNFVDNEEMLRAASRQDGGGKGNDEQPCSEDHLQLFHAFTRRIAQLRDDAFTVAHASHVRIQMGTDPTDTTRLLRKLVNNYTLTFLRKAAILMYVRYGVDYPDRGFAGMDEPEISRLTSALRLPSLDDLLVSFLSLDVDPASPFMHRCVAGWIIHWASLKVRNGWVNREELPLTHPGIFELVALPEKFDVLSEEAMKRRCPETGKELSEPSICLFCGEIFCGQALCCTKLEGNRTIGSCNRHVKK